MTRSVCAYAACGREVGATSSLTEPQFYVFKMNCWWWWWWWWYLANTEKYNMCQAFFQVPTLHVGTPLIRQ